MKTKFESRTVPIEKINPAAYNPRVDLKPGMVEYESLKKSILEFGYVDPLVWNEENGVLVGGHQRFTVLKELGYTEVDVSVVKIKDQRREKALNIALNKIQGDWDVPQLRELLVSLDDGEFDVGLTGFDEKSIQLLIGDGMDGERQQEDGDGGMSDKRATYDAGEIKQIVLYFSGPEYDAVVERLERVMGEIGASNHTETFLEILRRYENNRDQKKND